MKTEFIFTLEILNVNKCVINVNMYENLFYMCQLCILYPYI